METSIDTGLEGRAELLVTTHDTSIALRSGDVPVLATPRLLAVLEEATCAALAGTLEPHRTSVGTRVEITHRRPTPIGARVRAHAQLTSVDGDRLSFDVHAEHEEADGRIVDDIARGRITRVVVERSAFER